MRRSHSLRSLNNADLCNQAIDKLIDAKQFHSRIRPPVNVLRNKQILGDVFESGRSERR
jgi:hypothetical protein